MRREKLMLLGLIILSAWAMGQRRNMVLVIAGYQGEATVIDVNGKPFVDLRALAHMTNSSVTFEGDRVVMQPGMGGGSSPTPVEEGFSREFTSSAIEAIASMREWGSTLVMAIESGFPIGNSIAPYRGRAVDALRLASTAVANQADRDGLELLNREFRMVENWSNKLVNARNSLSAAKYTMSDDALRGDPEFQAIVRCGQFLGPMFATGRFRDDGSCR